MVEVLTSDEFRAWYGALDEDAQDDVADVIDELEAHGVALRFPKTTSIKGTNYPFRELRVQSNGRPLRVIYAFDPARNAYLIIGGDKTGDNRFYLRMVPLAERIWREYLSGR